MTIQACMRARWLCLCTCPNQSESLAWDSCAHAPMMKLGCSDAPGPRCNAKHGHAWERFSGEVPAVEASTSAAGGGTVFGACPMLCDGISRSQGGCAPQLPLVHTPSSPIVGHWLEQSPSSFTAFDPHAPSAHVSSLQTSLATENRHMNWPTSPKTRGRAPMPHTRYQCVTKQPGYGRGEPGEAR